MKRNHSFGILLLLFLLLPSNPIFPQDRHPINWKENKSSRLSDSSPISFAYGRKGDGFPDDLNIRGTITELTFAQAYCGGIAFAGTLKIKLLNKIEGYPPENVFVVVTCFLDPG